MANKPNAYKAQAPSARKHSSKTVRNTREKLTTVALPRDDRATQIENPDVLEPAPEWSLGNVPSEAATLNYTPAQQISAAPQAYLPAPRGIEAAIVSALVSLAKFARRKPGISLALAAVAGFAAGIGVRRI